MRSINAFSIISMEQAYWERHSEERKPDAGSGYPNRFQSLNQWFENTFGRLVGDGFGVRNWFGPCQEGDWTELYDIKDWWHIALLTCFSTIIGIYLVTTNNLALGILSFGMPIGVYAIYSAQTSNKRMILEWCAPKYLQEQLKLPILIVSLWVISSVILHVLLPQQIITSAVPTLLDQILNFYIPIINTPIIETFVFSAFVLSFAVYLGIIPSVSVISITVGIFHFVIFKGEPINIILSIILWFFLLALILKYKNPLPAVFGHSLANTLAIILNALMAG